jgi:hypothetical protein
LHKVREYSYYTIVGGTFCKLYDAESKRNSRDVVGNLSKCGFLFFGWPRVRGVVEDLSTRNRFTVVTLKIFVMIRIADFFNGSIGASAMRFSNSLRDAGREDGTLNGVCVIDYDFISVIYICLKNRNPYSS